MPKQKTLKRKKMPNRVGGNLPVNNGNTESFKEASKEYKENRRITGLEISNSTIDNDGAKHIAEILKYKESNRRPLDVLILKDNTILKNNEIEDGPIQIIVKAISEGTRELTIVGKGSEIKEKDAEAIGNMLKNKEQSGGLKTLTLKNCGINNEGAQEIGDGLEGNTALQSLNLDNNPIQDKGAAAIAEGLKTNKNLKNLSLDNNEITKEGANAIAKTLKENTSLTVFMTTWNQIGPNGTAAIVDALENNTALKKLWIRNAGIMSNPYKKEEKTRAVNAISKLLENNSTLKQLNLWGNFLDDTAAKTLAKSLEGNNALTELILGGNEITDEGAKSIGDMLKTNRTIITLELQRNKIGDTGAIALITGIIENGGNQTLKTLNLENNQITDEGAKTIANLLKGSNTTLTVLGLNNNKIKDEGHITAINTELNKNQTRENENNAKWNKLSQAEIIKKLKGDIDKLKKEILAANASKDEAFEERIQELEKNVKTLEAALKEAKEKLAENELRSLETNEELRKVKLKSKLESLKSSIAHTKTLIKLAKVKEPEPGEKTLRELEEKLEEDQQALYEKENEYIAFSPPGEEVSEEELTKRKLVKFIKEEKVKEQRKAITNVKEEREKGRKEFDEDKKTNKENIENAEKEIEKKKKIKTTANQELKKAEQTLEEKIEEQRKVLDVLAKEWLKAKETAETTRSEFTATELAFKKAKETEESCNKALEELEQQAEEEDTKVEEEESRKKSEETSESSEEKAKIKYETPKAAEKARKEAEKAREEAEKARDAAESKYQTAEKEKETKRKKWDEAHEASKKEIESLEAKKEIAETALKKATEDEKKTSKEEEAKISKAEKNIIGIESERKDAETKWEENIKNHKEKLRKNKEELADVAKYKKQAQRQYDKAKAISDKEEYTEELQYLELDLDRVSSKITSEEKEEKKRKEEEKNRTESFSTVASSLSMYVKERNLENGNAKPSKDENKKDNEEQPENENLKKLRKEKEELETETKTLNHKIREIDEKIKAIEKEEKEEKAAENKLRQQTTGPATTVDRGSVRAQEILHKQIENEKKEQLLFGKLQEYDAGNYHEEFKQKLSDLYTLSTILKTDRIELKNTKKAKSITKALESIGDFIPGSKALVDTLTAGVIFTDNWNTKKKLDAIYNIANDQHQMQYIIEEVSRRLVMGEAYKKENATTHLKRIITALKEGSIKKASNDVTSEGIIQQIVSAAKKPIKKENAVRKIINVLPGGEIAAKRLNKLLNNIGGNKTDSPKKEENFELINPEYTYEFEALKEIVEKSNFKTQYKKDLFALEVCKDKNALLKLVKQAKVNKPIICLYKIAEDKYATVVITARNKKITVLYRDTRGADIDTKLKNDLKKEGVSDIKVSYKKKMEDEVEIHPSSIMALENMKLIAHDLAAELNKKNNMFQKAQSAVSTVDKLKNYISGFEDKKFRLTLIGEVQRNKYIEYHAQSIAKTVIDENKDPHLTLEDMVNAVCEAVTLKHEINDVMKQNLAGFIEKQLEKDKRYTKELKNTKEPIKKAIDSYLEKKPTIVEQPRQIDPTPQNRPTPQNSVQEKLNQIFKIISTNYDGLSRFDNEQRKELKKNLNELIQENTKFKKAFLKANRGTVAKDINDELKNEKKAAVFLNIEKKLAPSIAEALKGKLNVKNEKTKNARLAV